MTLVRSQEEVFDLIQRVKSGAAEYHTNFFPTQPRLGQWIASRELSQVEINGTAVFLRRDRDFEHLYFCTGDRACLGPDLASVKELQDRPVTTDLVGAESAIRPLAEALEGGGFREYARLQRMSRTIATQGSETGAPVAGGEVVWARREDAAAALRLIESEFNRFAYQLPDAQEIVGATERQQILAVQVEGQLAALLFFETQGVSSLLRYWAVGTAYRDRRLGSALMKAYFAANPGVRRFVLWVAQANQNAIGKYVHYGYAPDGLVDIVMANKHVSDEISR